MRQHAIDPAQEGVRRAACRCWLFRFRASRFRLAILARTRRQITIDGLVAHLRHQSVTAALGHQLRNVGFGIAEIAEMAGRNRAGGNAGRDAGMFVQRLVVDLVDAERAFLHDADVVIVFARAIGAGPGAELAADALALIHQDDAVLRAFVRSAGRANGHAGRRFAMQAGAGEMHRAAVGAVARFESVDAVEPDAERVRAIGIEIGQRRHLAAAVPFLAVHRTGVTADANVEVDDQAELLCAWRRQARHRFASLRPRKCAPYFRIAAGAFRPASRGSAGSCGDVSAWGCGTVLMRRTFRSYQAAWPVTGSLLE